MKTKYIFSWEATYRWTLEQASFIGVDGVWKTCIAITTTIFQNYFHAYGLLQLNKTEEKELLKKIGYCMN